MGTRQGHLLLYGVKDGSGKAEFKLICIVHVQFSLCYQSQHICFISIGDNRFEVELRSSNKLFSKKPIMQV